MNNHTEEKDPKGSLYVMFNDVFKHYGDNVYKLGKARDCEKKCMVM
jgi:hypothetical protein